MSEIAERPRRADARRSVARIMDAAIRVLSERPDASVEEVAVAAGVTRQTVYAHYPSRDSLIAAVLDRLTEAAMAALDAADLAQGPAAAALVRLLDVSWDMFERYPLLLVAGSEQADHQPVAEPILHLIRRGQRAGEFDRELRADWLLSATIALGHLAGTEVTTGRLTAARARTVLRTSVLRLYGVHDLA